MFRKIISGLMVLAMAIAVPAWAKQSKPPKAAGLAGEKAAAVKITDGPRVEGVGADWAVIAWTTNTGGSSVIHFGANANSLNEMAEAPYADNEKTSAQNHRVRLTHLKPGTTYYFVADSGQGEGTGTESKSSVGQFTTKAH